VILPSKPNIIFYAATVFWEIISGGYGGKQGNPRVLAGFFLLSGCVMLRIPVLCSHCIKMRICYLRTSKSEGSFFPKNKFLIVFIGLAAFMSSAPGSIWTVGKEEIEKLLPPVRSNLQTIQKVNVGESMITLY